MPSSHREAAEKSPHQQQQHKEAAPPPPPPPFVRPFEDSFQPKAPVSLRNSHTPPAILTSPKQAALSLAPHERTEKVDAAPPPGSSKLLLPTSSPSSSSSSLPLCVPFVPQSSAAPPPQQPPTPPQHPPPPQDEAKPLPPRPDITAVLNVPDKAKVMAAVKESAAASHNHFARNLHAQRQMNEKTESVPLTSKLDLAEKRRRDRRMRTNGGGAHVEERQNHLPAGLLPNGNSLFASSISTGSSDSEQDWDSDGETGSWRQQHLLLTKGPPCKLEAPPQKLFFLQMFGLTTLAKKNDLELQKCERRVTRHWEDYNSLPLETADEDSEDVGPLPLELPYPSGSPDSFNKASDYNSKICFLRYLNVEPLSQGKRAEREKLWQYSLSDRLRRNSINPVVLYTRNQNQMKREATASKEAGVGAREPMAKRSSKEPSPCTQLNVPRPTLSSAAPPSAAGSAVVVVNNGAVRSQVSKMACLPSTAHRRASSSEDDDLPAKVPKWNGIEEVMEAYQRYVKETDLEMQVLREHCQRLHQQLLDGRQKAEQLDTRLRELVARKNMQDYERHQIQSALDQLNSCLRKLR